MGVNLCRKRPLYVNYSASPHSIRHSNATSWKEGYLLNLKPKSQASFSKPTECLCVKPSLYNPHIYPQVFPIPTLAKRQLEAGQISGMRPKSQKSRRRSCRPAGGLLNVVLVAS